MQDHLVHEKGEKYNRRGKYGYAIVVVVFQLIFWMVAFYEFMRPAEAYLKRGLRSWLHIIQSIAMKALITRFDALK